MYRLIICGNEDLTVHTRPASLHFASQTCHCTSATSKNMINKYCERTSCTKLNVFTSPVSLADQKRGCVLIYLIRRSNSSNCWRSRRSWISARVARFYKIISRKITSDKGRKYRIEQEPLLHGRLEFRCKGHGCLKQELCSGCVGCR